jgi:Gas vesicle synthesis protein GvpL/GvpF
MVAKYVYGVIHADTPAPRCRGIAGAPVSTLVHEDLAAVVSDLPEDALEADRDDLVVHSQVLSAALENGPVLPMRFGLLLEDESAVREGFLAPFHDTLSVQLHDVDGKAELHLRATYDESRVMREAVEVNPAIARLRDSLTDRPADATYYERIELGQMVAEGVERIRQQDTDAIVQALAPLAVATHVDPVEHEQVAASLCFLVEENGLEAFDAAVDELGRREGERLRFKYTGPFPAYSFVELPA